jgi:hypothetical protein
MHWIIQNKMREEAGVRVLAESLPRWGIPHSFHDFGDDWKLVPEPKPAGNVVVIGAYAIRHEAKRKGWVPGLFDLEHLDYRDFLGNWGGALLNAEAAIWRFADIPPSSLPNQFFCRPGQDNKFWKAGPTTREEFLEWHAQFRKLWDDPEAHSSIRPDTWTVVAPLKEIAQEHRFWIVDGRVVTSSLYKRGDQVVYESHSDPEVVAFAEGIAAHPWQPHRAYVLDVSVGSGGELHVIEANNLGSAGLYAADVRKLVATIEEMKF